MKEIEKLFTNYVRENFDELFHKLVSELKGPNKVCLIKDKWTQVSQT